MSRYLRLSLALLLPLVMAGASWAACARHVARPRPTAAARRQQYVTHRLRPNG